jgi:[ribosomal protein S18]-alanine N-acetyltransferase
VSVLTRLRRVAAPTGLTIEPMKRRHLPEVLAIEAVSYPRPWTATVFQGELEQARRGHRVYLVARDGGNIVGYGGMMLVDGDGHISNLASSTAQRRRGVATRVLAELAWAAIDRDCTALTLEVRVTNHAAQSLYERFGFTQAGVRPRYYENTDDALVMWCDGIRSEQYQQRLVALCPEATR